MYKYLTPTLVLKGLGKLPTVYLYDLKVSKRIDQFERKPRKSTHASDSNP